LFCVHSIDFYSKKIREQEEEEGRNKTKTVLQMIARCLSNLHLRVHATVFVRVTPRDSLAGKKGNPPTEKAAHGRGRPGYSFRRRFLIGQSTRLPFEVE
jgi:hypothetical protein